MIAFAPFRIRAGKEIVFAASRSDMGLLKKYIDSLEFARIRGAMAGALAIADLPRLQDVLVSNEGELTVGFDGSRDNDGKSWLHLTVDGELQLECQRCLAGVALPLAIRRHLQLVPPGGKWPEDDLDDDSTDAIASAKELKVLDLVEDEVLLALPLVAKHAKCEPPLPEKAKGEADAGTITKKASPFLALAALKKK